MKNLAIENPTPLPTHETLIADIYRNVGYFAEHPYRHLGDSDSGHGVLFGTLSPYGDVAIKPFTLTVRALHEKEVLEYARGEGFDTIEPLEVASEGLYAYLISKYRPDLRHLGQLSWNENVASRRLHREITPAVNFAANLAGSLQVRGITHGDMQAKNIMLSTSGTPVLADMENGQIKLRGTELAKKGDRDLARFGISVLRRGLLADRSIRYRLGYLGDELINPALEVAELPTNYDRRDAVKTAIAEAIDKYVRGRHPKVHDLHRRIA